MPTPVIIETPGASNANSYESLAEFNTYLASRLHVPASVSAADPNTKKAGLIMATKAIDHVLTRFRRLEVVQGKSGMSKFYITRPYWTGSPSTTTQSLAWPRSGMFDRNGNEIGTTIIPQELKDAESEMAIIAINTDILADNEVIVQGITSIKAGPVALTFKDYIQKRLLPDAVLLALVPSWMTDELYENIPIGRFGTIGLRGRC